MPRNPYQQAAQSSPQAAGRRLIEIYRIAGAAARRAEPAAIAQALALLRATLNPAASPEIALSLAAIYQDMDQALAAQDYPTLAHDFEALAYLWEARLAWSEERDLGMRQAE